MSRARSIRGALLSLALGGWLGAGSAMAAPTPPDEAKRLFEEATAAMQRKDFAEACPKLERVVELVPDGIGAKLALGDCYLGVGRSASAQRAYVAAEAAAAAARNAERQRDARGRADALTPRLAQLTLELADAVRALPDLAITRDGTPISVAELGIPIAVDAGEHVVRVTARGHAPFEQRATIADGAKQVLKVDALEPERAPEPAPGPAPVAPPPAPVRAPAPAPAGFWDAQRYAGLSLGVVGLAGLGVAAGFTVATKVAVDDSNAMGCDPETAVCPDAASLDRREQALLFAHVATGSWIAGGVVAATGVVLFATAAGPGAAVAVAPNGLVLRGRF